MDENVHAVDTSHRALLLCVAYSLSKSMNNRGSRRLFEMRSRMRFSLGSISQMATRPLCRCCKAPWTLRESDRSSICVQAAVDRGWNFLESCNIESDRDIRRGFRFV